ncbi:hypothetical protein Tco_0164174, partial [Tanacetum coccineum]
MGIMTRTEVSGRIDEARGRRMILPRKYSRDTNPIIGSELTLLASSELKTSELDTSELKTSEY